MTLLLTGDLNYLVQISPKIAQLMASQGSHDMEGISHILPENGQLWHDLRSGDQKALHFSPNVPRCLCQLISAMINPNPHQRPTARDILTLHLPEVSRALALAQLEAEEAKESAMIEGDGDEVQSLSLTSSRLDALNCTASSVSSASHLFNISARSNGAADISYVSDISEVSNSAFVCRSISKGSYGSPKNGSHSAMDTETETEIEKIPGGSMGSILWKPIVSMSSNSDRNCRSSSTRSPPPSCLQSRSTSCFEPGNLHHP
jgi:hypothetical protein